jgi:membrane associated rhomboid family serine protease
MAFKMSPGADLFIVCRQCGSEVSPYITECPYCGHRLRRRAPKLPKERPGREREHRREGAAIARLRAPARLIGAGVDSRPYATIVLVLAACGVWIATTSGFVSPAKLSLEGPVHGQWWRLFSSQFLYASGVYAFVALLAVAVFGWLLERRHGPVVVLALFLGAGVTGALVAEAAFAYPVITGANAGALCLIAAWAAPDLRAARGREWHEGDLLGAAAFAAALLAMPFARAEANWLAGVVGAAFGLVLGLGLSRIRSTSEI